MENSKRKSKIIKIDTKTDPEKKAFDYLTKILNRKEINLTAMGSAITNLENIFEILSILRPDFHMYYKCNTINKKMPEMIVKITLDKLEEIPEGYKQNLSQEETDKIQRFLSSENIVSLEEDEEFKKRIESKCMKIREKQKNYYSYYKKITEITIIYKIDFQEIDKGIKIFGKEFVYNNKNNCSIKYKNKEMELTDIFELDEEIYNNIDDPVLEIKLKGINKVENMSFLFFKCKNLLALPDISFLDFSKIKKTSAMFYKCYSLFYLPNISYWDIRNVTDMNYMFAYCHSLQDLPDISKWNTSNVKFMRSMFSNCSSLLYLPDISNWKTSNILDINGIFEGCEKLQTLPEISKWDTSNITDIGKIFSNCTSLKVLPDLSKWNTNKLENINSIFNNCSSLKSLPDI